MASTWSAYIAGWYRAQLQHQFEATINVHSSIPILHHPLDSPTIWLDAENRLLDARVILTRYPSRSFDGVALDELASFDIAYQFLLNLGRSADAEFQIR